MAITRVEAQALADANSATVTADMNAIYDLITSEATAGKYQTEWVILHQSIKNVLLTNLTDPPNSFNAYISEDGLSILIYFLPAA